MLRYGAVPQGFTSACADEIRSRGSYTNVPLTPGQEPNAEPVPLPSPVVPAVLQSKSGASAMRRVLRRVRDGVALNVDEAATALTARGDDLADLCSSAARVRDAGLESAGRRGVAGGLPITYSRKVFIPVTHLCRDNCHYCTFVTVPGKLRTQGMGMYMEPDESLTSPAAAPNSVARKRYSHSATAPRTVGRRHASGSANGATTPRCPTYGRWRSGCWRKPGCCHT